MTLEESVEYFRQIVGAIESKNDLNVLIPDYKELISFVKHNPSTFTYLKRLVETYLSILKRKD